MTRRSNGWHTGPLAAFDIESTGVDPATARIVTACVATIDGAGGTVHPRHWLLDPGAPIPPEATAINGITTEHAQQHGIPTADALQQIVPALYQAWHAGAVLVGHNAAYDLTILDTELRRHGHPPLEIAGPVIDTLVLDKQVDRYRRGSRRLPDTCAHYRVRHDGAHNASEDALAAARIAWRIATLHPEVGAMPADALHAAQVVWAAEQAARFAAHLRRLAAGHHDPAEAAALNAKADAVTGTWPIHTPIGAPA